MFKRVLLVLVLVISSAWSKQVILSHIGEISRDEGLSPLFLELNGNYLYSANNDNAKSDGYMHIIDVTNKNQPFIVSKYYTGGREDILAYFQNTVFLADYYNGLYSIDISNSLSLSGEKVISETSIMGLVAKDNYLYVGGSTNDVKIYEINGTSLTLKSTIPNNSSSSRGTGQKICINSNTMAFVKGIDYIELYDITDKTNPIHKSTLNEEAKVIYCSSNNLFIGRGGNIKIYNISNPSNPIKLSNHSLLTDSSIFEDFYVYNNLLFVAGYLRGIYIIDVENPSNPVTVLHYDNDDSVFGIRADDKYIYVGSSLGLNIYEYTVTDNEIPNLNLSFSPTLVYQNDLVSFTAIASDTDGSIVSYKWEFGDGSTSTETNPTHTYTTIGTYTVNCTVTDNEGATTSKTLTITVSNPPNQPPTLSISTSNTNPSVYENINFTAVATDENGSIASYSWNFGDGTTSSLQNPTHSYTQIGTYDVNCTVTDNNDSNTSKSLTITVSELTCADSQKIENGTCVTKTCQNDGYGCPTCTVNQILKYNADGTGYCQKSNTKPIATNIEVTTTEDTSITITLNATDSENDTLTYSTVSEPLNGTYTIAGDKILYTPKSNFFGTDLFSYIANDGEFDSNIATVTIEVVEGEYEALTTSKEKIYLADYLNASDISISVSGGKAPYTWNSENGGTITGSNSDKSKVYYIPNSAVNVDDVITVKDSLNQTVTINVITVKGNGCEVTPATRYLTKNENTTFTLTGSGCLAPFSAIVISGEADIEEDGNEFIITASKVNETVKIKFSDSAKHEVTSEMEVVGKLTCSTQNIYLEDLESDREFTVSNGIAPYVANTTIGGVSVNSNNITFTPPTRYEDGIITVSSADGQECSVNVSPNDGGGDKVTISPSFAKLELSDMYKFTASLGTGVYNWKANIGSIEKLNDTTALYTAPKYDTIDIVTVTDNSGQKATATIKVCEDISNCDSSVPEIKLTKGWNLVSIPVDVSFVEVANGAIPKFGTRDIKELGEYNSIWTFIDNNWRAFKTLDKLEPRIGFWINSLESEKSIYFDEESYQINFNSLSKGWHLLGSGEVLENPHTNSNIEVVYTYDSYLGKWSKNPQTVDLGQGFWIKK